MVQVRSNVVSVVALCLSICFCAAAARATATPATTATPPATPTAGTPAATPTPGTPEPSSTPVTPLPSPTAAPSLPPPTLIAPADDARFTPAEAPPVFSWTVVDGAAEYEWELALDEDFALASGPLPATGPAADLGDLIDPAQWDPLLVTLFWRARALDGDGSAGAWSVVRTFHKSLLAAPELKTPADGERFVAGDPLPRFSWTVIASAAEYQLGFALDREFTEPLGIANTGRSSPYLDLSNIRSPEWDAYSGELYWRAAALAPGGVAGPWAEARGFSKSNAAPPALIAPPADAKFPAESPPIDFQWDGAGPDGSTWEFQLSATEDFATVAGAVQLDEPALLLSGMVEDELWWTVFGTYWWRVARTEPGEGPGPWSEARRFSKMGRHRFLAWGDSITFGECVDNGYCGMMLPALTAMYPGAVIVNQGIPGAKSWQGAAYLEDILLAVCPQYALIQFGDNDCVDPFNCNPSFECDVDGHMADMTGMCREYGCVPVISTLVPINPISRFASAQATASMWSGRIRDLGPSLNVSIADLEAWFFDYPGYPPDLYCYAGDDEIIDWVHPNETGYDIMIDCFLGALNGNLGW